MVYYEMGLSHIYGHVSGIGWLRHHTDVVFRQKLIYKRNGICRYVVVVQNPKVVCPKSGTFSVDCPTQIVPKY